LEEEKNERGKFATLIVFCSKTRSSGMFLSTKGLSNLPRLEESNDFEEGRIVQSLEFNPLDFLKSPSEFVLIVKNLFLFDAREFSRYRALCRHKTSVS
jgi:hypothetical protein